MSEQVKPIRPEEIAQANFIPADVFTVFNRLISAYFNQGSATFAQNVIVDLLVEMGYSRFDIFNNGWLNIESAYEAAGWRVEYDKPGFNESYSATFRFTKR